MGTERVLPQRLPSTPGRNLTTRVGAFSLGRLRRMEARAAVGAPMYLSPRHRGRTLSPTPELSRDRTSGERSVRRISSGAWGGTRHIPLHRALTIGNGCIAGFHRSGLFAPSWTAPAVCWGRAYRTLGPPHGRGVTAVSPRARLRRFWWITAHTNPAPPSSRRVLGSAEPTPGGQHQWHRLRAWFTPLNRTGTITGSENDRIAGGGRRFRRSDASRSFRHGDGVTGSPRLVTIWSTR
nr:hypothetical protein ICEMyc226_00213 [Mycolicibacterium sp.]